MTQSTPPETNPSENQSPSLGEQLPVQQDKQGMLKYLGKSIWQEGFGKKEATVREYVLILATTFAVYTVLHLIWPPRQMLSPGASQAQTVVLGEIDRFNQLINSLASGEVSSSPVATLKPAPTLTSTPIVTPTTIQPTPTLTSTTTIAPTAIATPTTTPSAIITPTPSLTPGIPSTSPQGNLPTSQRQVQNSFKESLNQQLPTIANWPQTLRPYFAEHPSKESEIKSYIQELSQKTQNFNSQNEAQKKIKLKEIQQVLSTIQGSLQENSLFWTGNGKWFEVGFWSLFGTLFYIIQQITEYLLQEDDEEENTTLQDNTTKFNRSQAILKRRNPQYYSFILQSPFITLVVLWTLSAAVFNIGGVSLNFNDFSEEVLVSLAFILGLFNRVTATQLNLIVAGIFKDAWQKTVRPINISPGSEKVAYGNCKQFNVIPDVKVEWSIYSEPQLGIIDAATGMYIAPPFEDVSYENGKLISLKLKENNNNPVNNNPDSPADNPANNSSVNNNDQDSLVTKKNNKVIIKAVRADDQTISALALITLTDEKNV